MLKYIYRYTPAPFWNTARFFYRAYIKRKYLKGKRPFVPGETSKAYQRRINENFFDLYCRGRGLDIGYGGDPVKPGVDVWDFEHGDAQLLSGVPDSLYDFVYSSHTLEHLNDPGEALINWWRVLKPGGILLLYIPHRDLYEKKKTLPSRFNDNHKHFFIIDNDEAPDTIGLRSLIEKTLNNFEIIYIKTCSYGNTITDPYQHSNGEYSIEAVIRKVK